MKNLLTSLFFVSIGFSAYGQKIIENPQYGMNSLPGKITKIELLDTATAMHFHIEFRPGNWISIPKKAYIQVVGNEEKLYVMNSEGIEIGKRYIIPESGTADYTLYFPKIPADASYIDCREEVGNWQIYDIVINEQEVQSMLPNELLGNWRKTDGTNDWHFGFYPTMTIVERDIWKYKSVEKVEKTHIITLESGNKTKVIYAQMVKNGTVDMGENIFNLENYDNKKTDNPNCTVPKDQAYSSDLFMLDSATYSGVINGFTQRADKKTGMVHVNNILTGKQDSHLVTIAKDGSFSVKFPLYHPQYIFVRLPYLTGMVYVEPGKETWHFKDQEDYFMGDCARVNTDLVELASIKNFNSAKVRSKILELLPEEYKEICIEAKKKDKEQFQQVLETRFIGKKARQIKQLDIKYEALSNLVSFEMQRQSAIYQAKKNPNAKSPINIKEIILDESYLDFLSEKDLKDQNAVLSSGYSGFINRLMFAKIFRAESMELRTAQLAELLVESGEVLSEEEKEMIAASKVVENDEVSKRKQDFNKKYSMDFSMFMRKYMKEFRELQKDKKPGHPAVTIAEMLEKEGIELTPREREMVQAAKSISTSEQTQKESVFQEKYGEISKTFKAKHSEFSRQKMMEQYSNYRDIKMRKVFGIENSFAFDVITSQSECRKIVSDFTPLTKESLKNLQGRIENPFIKEYVAITNEYVQRKIESNKSNTGFVAHETPKTEADKVFDSIMAKFKGKVVYVDFWATWCGPCISAMKSIAPLKEEMKDEKVAFVYITNPSSPEKTYKNMIPDINGEHFRLSQDEWNYLAGKFNISGIPHYTLVDKKGIVVRPKMRHSSNESLKQILQEQMAL